jgi:hypothetical protein
MVPVHFVSQVFSLPLKTDEHPHGIFTEYEMYMTLAVCFTYIFLDVDPAKHFQLREAATALAQQLAKLVTLNVKDVEDDTIFEKLLSQFKPVRKELADYGVHMIKRLLVGGKSAEDVVWEVIPTAVAGNANQGQAVSPLSCFARQTVTKFLQISNKQGHLFSLPISLTYTSPSPTTPSTGMRSLRSQGLTPQMQTTISANMSLRACVSTPKLLASSAGSKTTALQSKTEGAPLAPEKATSCSPPFTVLFLTRASSLNRKRSSWIGPRTSTLCMDMARMSAWVRRLIFWPWRQC